MRVQTLQDAIYEPNSKGGSHADPERNPYAEH